MGGGLFFGLVVGVLVALPARKAGAFRVLSLSASEEQRLSLVRRFFSHGARGPEPVPVYLTADVDLTHLRATRALTYMLRRRTFSMYEGISFAKGDAFTAACTLTHRRAWQRVLDLNTSAVLILEDDATEETRSTRSSSRGENRAITAARLVAYEIARLDPSWDMVNLGRCYDHCVSQEILARSTFIPGVSYTRSIMPACTHAYLVSRAGASKLLTHSMPYVTALDHLISALSRQGLLRVISTTPRLFGQLPTPNASEATAPAARSTSAPLALEENSKSMPDERATQAFGRRHDERVMPECHPDPLNTTRYDQWVRYLAPGDRLAISAPFGTAWSSWLTAWSPLAEQCPATYAKLFPPAAAPPVDAALSALSSVTGTEAWTKPPSLSRRRRCALLEQQCVFVGGRKKSAPASGELGVQSKALAHRLRALGLWGVVVYDLPLTGSHTHKYVHAALYQAVLYALAASPVRMHVCWLEALALGEGCSLCPFLGSSACKPYASAAGARQNPSDLLLRLGRSLVLASPKHMAWSTDPTLALLPSEATSSYAFHDLTPARFRWLKPLGRVIEWRVWGSDGHPDFLDSIYRTPAVSGLAASPQQTASLRASFFDRARSSYVSHWAAPALGWTYTQHTQRGAAGSSGSGSGSRPHQSSLRGEARERQYTSAPLEPGRQPALPRVVHYVGSVWPWSVDALIAFARGCVAVNVSVHVHSATRLLNASKLLELRRLAVLHEAPFVTAELRDELLRSSLFVLALHSGRQLRSGADGSSFVSDRVLLGALLELPIATNSRRALELLGAGSAAIVTVARNASRLCAIAALRAERQLREPRSEVGSRMARLVRANHTYVSRLLEIASVLRPLHPPDLFAALAAVRESALREQADWCAPRSVWAQRVLEIQRAEAWPGT